MAEPTHLHLSRSDLWKRHGFLNVAMTLGAPLVGSTAAFALVVGHRFNLTAMALLVLLIAFPLANRQVLRSALAIGSVELNGRFGPIQSDGPDFPVGGARE